MVKATLALAIGAAAAACTAGIEDPASLPALDRDDFRCAVQPVLAARCAFAGCHASARRPLRLYAVGRMRLGVGWDRLAEPLTADELEANYQATRGFALDDPPLLLAKPLDPRAGGWFHRGQSLYGGDDVFLSTDDPGYALLAAWIGGATAAADCTPTTEVMP
jgi:hypothetical protein